MVGTENSQQMRMDWNAATEALPYGVANVFHDILTLVAEGFKTDLVYGADYRPDGGACLVNSASSMLTTGGGKGVPMANFPEVVSLFDRINQHLYEQGYSDNSSYVTEEAAEVLLQWFGDIKEPTPEQIEAAKAEAFAKGVPYVEPTDEDLKAAFEAMLEAPSVPETTPFDAVTEAHTNAEHSA